MAIELNEVRLEELSDINFSFWIGKHPGESYEKSVMVVRFEGVYRIGSGGNSDATFMVAMGNAGVEAFEPDAIIIDLSSLAYEWGDMMDSVFGIGSDRKVPTAIIVGEQCRPAIGTLCFGVNSTKDACEHDDIFDSLEAAWSYVTRLLNENDKPAIHQAASEGDFRKVKQLLDEGEDPNRLDSSEQTPLHSSKNASIVELLLQAGADATAKNRFGITPLHLVNEVESARLLLDAGADPDARSWTGSSPLSHANSVELVQLLIEAGADVHLRQRSSILHSVRHPEIAKALIEAGADINLLDENGQTPLDCAEKSHEIFHRQAQAYEWGSDADTASRYEKICSILRASGGKSGSEIKSRKR
jgi:hypothetical protein